jgi:hypothetical protein
MIGFLKYRKLRLADSSLTFHSLRLAYLHPDMPASWSPRIALGQSVFEADRVAVLHVLAWRDCSAKQGQSGNMSLALSGC